MESSDVLDPCPVCYNFSHRGVPCRDKTYEESVMHWWDGGNLPVLNSFFHAVEEVATGLRRATMAFPALIDNLVEVRPKISALCDAARDTVDAWRKQGHQNCQCEVCQAVDRLYCCWEAFDPRR